MCRTVYSGSSLLVCVFVVLSCYDSTKRSSLPYYNTPDFEPHFFHRTSDAEREVTHKVGSFSLTNQWGKKIADNDLDGKIHVANFIFTTCGSICPVMTKHMKMVAAAHHNDPEVILLSYTVAPWIDSVQRLKKYTENNGIRASNWHFLTGAQSEIYSLARRSYFAEEELGYTRDSTEFLHTEHILLTDQTRRIRGIYNGTLPLEIEQLLRDIKTLKEEREN